MTKMPSSPSSCCISHHFALTASENPNSIAVIHATTPPISVTYSALSAAVAALARRLQTLTPSTIAIHIPPSPAYIVAVLAVLRSHHIFLPLDPASPDHRLSSLLSASRARAVITCLGLNEVDYRGVDVVYIQMEGNEVDEQEFICAKGREYCYLMYTSGSTGKAKGVCGTEEGLMNRFRWMQEEFPLCREDVLLFKTSIGFIDHIQEFLSAVLTGTTLVVPQYDQLKSNPSYLVSVIKAYHITRLTAVPSLMRAILPSLESLDGLQIRRTLKVLVLSGETLSLSLWKRLREALPEATILNLYGSTEVSGDCTYFNCISLPKILETQSVSSVPIGTPISNCEITLVGKSDASGEGEIYVSGPCLMTGYFGEPVKDVRHVKTGDFARRLPSGDLIFLGRKDRTVKVNGQRMALEEIENTLREHPEVQDSAVTLCKPEGGLSYLDAYFTTRSTEGFHNLQLDQKDMIQELIMSIRTWLVRKLPSAMIPTRYFCTEVLPRAASGKIDYTKLPSSAVAMQPKVDYERNHLFDHHLQIIKEVFCSALQVKEITNFDDFFIMGGNSISAAHATHKLGIDMRLLYIYPSPLELVNAMLDQKKLHGHSFVGRESGKRLKVDDNLLSLFDESKTSIHDGMLLENMGEKVHNNFRILESHTSTTPLERNDGPLVNVEADSFLASNDAISLHRGTWISNVNLPKLCSFSRCNQFMHEGELYHEADSRFEIPRNMNSCLQETWKVLAESCVDASPLVVFKNGNVHLLIGSHSHILMCIDAVSDSCTVLA